MIGVLSFWIMLHVWLPMKHAYGQGFFRTTFKYWRLGLAYFTLLNLGMAATVVVVLLV